MTEGPAYPTVGPDTVPVRRLDSRVRSVGGRFLVAGPTSALELDVTARSVWRAIDGGRSVSAIARSLADEYDVDPGTAVGDVVELVEELVRCEVVTLRQPSPRRGPG